MSASSSTVVEQAAATQTTARPELLAVENVNAGYGNLQILKNVSFNVGSGEIVTLIGSNGAGKTTVLNTICGIVRARAGSIRFAETNITAVPTPQIAALGIAHVPEGRKLFTDMTVLENLEMGAFLRRDRPEIKLDIEKMYGLFPRLKSGARHVREVFPVASSKCVRLRVG